MSLFNPLLSSARASAPRRVPVGTFCAAPGATRDSSVMQAVRARGLPRGVAELQERAHVRSDHA